MSVAPSAVAAPPSRFQQFYALTKPRVVQLIVFCALIGMVLAVPGLPSAAELLRMVIACVGIWLVAGAAVQSLLRNRIILIIRLLGNEGHETGRLHPHIVVRPAGFDQADTPRAVLGKPSRRRASGAAAARPLVPRPCRRSGS